MLNDSTAIFTVCNIAYLPKALVLAESVASQDGRRLKIYLFDRKSDFGSMPDIADIFWIEDINVPDFQQLAFIYDIIEFSTSLKPFIALQLLHSHQAVIFLDPDTCIFSHLAPIDADLERHPIVLTPHYLKPQPRTPGESDLGMMRFGSFNLGFFAVSKSDEGLAFLQWWSDRCIDFCFMESQFGLSTDQKWVSIAPCFFPNIYISFNPGYNAAPWNTFERSLSVNSEGELVVSEAYPLVFFHFSNFDKNDLQYLNKRASCESGVSYPTLYQLSEAYSKRLDDMGSLIKSVPYAYDYLSDGSYISPTLRRAYWSVRAEFPRGHDPFDKEGPVGKFAVKNRLLAISKSKYRYLGFRDAAANQGKLRVVVFLLRYLLRAIGPNRSYDLSKLFVYLSLYRRVEGLWKL